ncbi:MAG: adenylyltransferase/cytidyltransferase family protein [Candidatus Saganbacteria bacterium]|nr:adenylyltransferase/cytidyltransferase family protein [Candidatus Saganbacteria bacterium]
MKVGLLYGRFQPPTKGHQPIVKKMKAECDKAVVLVGFGQDGGTERNPLNVVEVISLWQKIEPKGVIFGFMNELDKASPQWAEWIFWHCKLFSGSYPTHIYGGPDCWGVSRGLDVWNPVKEKHPLEVVCVDSRHANISATAVRQSLIDGTDYWRGATDQRIHQDLENLREVFIRTQGVEQQFKIIPDSNIKVLT